MAKKQLNVETKPHLILDNICPQTPKRIVTGEILDKKTLEWIDASGQTVPEGTTIRAGSMVELTDQQAKQLIRLGVLVPDGDVVHFNLEDVFTLEVTFFQQVVPMHQVLRAYGINTLEQIVNNVDGHKPLLDSEGKGALIKAQDILKLYGNQEQVQAWIERCKQIVCAA